MPRLTPCPSCHAHVMPDERSCPHCGVGLRPSANRGAVVLMGLALAGCPSTAEPEYGVPDTSPMEDDSGSASSTAETADTAETAEPEYGVPDTGEPSETESGEPDYGVPETTGGEPEYGVPDTGDAG